MGKASHSLQVSDTVYSVKVGTVPNVFSIPNGRMHDLAQCITPQTGLIVSKVETILENGQILASGGFFFPDGLIRTVVLTPRANKFRRPVD